MTEISGKINSHFDCICLKALIKQREIPDLIKNNTCIDKGFKWHEFKFGHSAIINFQRIEFEIIFILGTNYAV